jgi:hypothetical protein
LNERLFLFYEIDSRKARGHLECSGGDRSKVLSLVVLKCILGARGVVTRVLMRSTEVGAQEEHAMHENIVEQVP